MAPSSRLSLVIVLTFSVSPKNKIGGKKTMAELQDKTLNCRDCQKEFVFTIGEQEFYREKGFENEPKDCADCRKAKKQARRDNWNRKDR